MLDKEEAKKRIKDRINIDKNGCWIWPTTYSSGYGQLWINGKGGPVHCVSYEIFKDYVLKEGEVICHRCDVKACVNPDHLWVGTKEQNSRDIGDMNRAKSFNQEYYRDKLERIKNDKVLSISSLARELNISYPTVSSFLKGKNLGDTSYVTKKKIVNFVSDFLRENDEKVEHKTRKHFYISNDVLKMLNEYAYEHFHKKGKSPNYSEIVEDALKEYLDKFKEDKG